MKSMPLASRVSKATSVESNSDSPSNTALATSVASARVGRKLSVILSTTRVSTAGFPAILHL